MRFHVVRIYHVWKKSFIQFVPSVSHSLVVHTCNMLFTFYYKLKMRQYSILDMKICFRMYRRNLSLVNNLGYDEQCVCHFKFNMFRLNKKQKEEHQWLIKNTLKRRASVTNSKNPQKRSIRYWFQKPWKEEHQVLNPKTLTTEAPINNLF